MSDDPESLSSQIRLNIKSIATTILLQLLIAKLEQQQPDLRNALRKEVGPFLDQVLRATAAPPDVEQDLRQAIATMLTEDIRLSS